MSINFNNLYRITNNFVSFDEEVTQKSIELIGKDLMHHRNRGDENAYERAKNYVPKQHNLAVRRFGALAKKRARDATDDSKGFLSKAKERFGADHHLFKLAKEKAEEKSKVILSGKDDVDKSLAKRDKAFSTNIEGGSIKTNSITSDRYGNNPAYSMYHNMKNNRRTLAASRLIGILDKKGHTDETYAARHAENEQRRAVAREKHNN
jgi:hypothetical protein